MPRPTRAAAAGAEVLRQPGNTGKGAALRAGLEWLAARGAERVLTMDGDGQHLADQIPALLEASAREPHALVIGARQVDPELVTPMRPFGNRFANRWVEIASGLALPDTQSGFRVYPMPETLALGTAPGHFAFETEVLIRAARGGLQRALGAGAGVLSAPRPSASATSARSSTPCASSQSCCG